MENKIVWRVYNRSKCVIEDVFRTKTSLNDEKFCDEFLRHIPESHGDHIFGDWIVLMVNGCLQHRFIYERENGDKIMVIELVDY